MMNRYPYYLNRDAALVAADAMTERRYYLNATADGWSRDEAASALQRAREEAARQQAPLVKPQPEDICEGGISI